MSKLHILKQLYLSYKKGNIGDVALLKIALTGMRLHSNAYKALNNIEFSLMDISIKKLNQYPNGSLAQAYANFLCCNHIKPFNISKKYLDFASMYQAELRYLQTHDLFHVILGYDTSLTGELGVLVFTYAQKIYKYQLLAVISAFFFYSLLEPYNMVNFYKTAKEAYSLGKKLPHLLSIQYEDYWGASINKLHADIGINKVKS